MPLILFKPSSSAFFLNSMHIPKLRKPYPSKERCYLNWRVRVKHLPCMLLSSIPSTTWSPLSTTRHETLSTKSGICPEHIVVQNVHDVVQKTKNHHQHQQKNMYLNWPERVNGMLALLPASGIKGALSPSKDNWFQQVVKEMNKQKLLQVLCAHYFPGFDGLHLHVANFRSVYFFLFTVLFFYHPQIKSGKIKMNANYPNQMVLLILIL